VGDRTNKFLWEVTVFRNSINPLKDEDAQWVFIKKLSIVDGMNRARLQRGCEDARGEEPAKCVIR